MADDDLIELCLDALERVVARTGPDPLGGRVLRQPLGYPVFHTRLRSRPPAAGHDGTGIEGLLSIGRNGEFDHILMEDIYWRTLARIEAWVAAEQAEHDRADGLKAPTPPYDDGYVRRGHSHRLRHRGSSRSTDRGRPRRLGSGARLGEPGQAAVHPRHLPVDVPRPALDDAPVRRLRHAPKSTNERFKFLLAAGQTGLSCAFDLPTQMGYDSDHPRAEGEVGKVGVAIDSIADMRLLLHDLPLDKVTTSMTINSTAAILLLLYELVAEEQGVPSDGDQRHDPERHPEGVHRPRHVRLPAAAESMRIITDIFAYCREHVPKWNTISISGYHIREAGSTAVQEIAFTLANGIAYVQAAHRRRPRRRRVRAAAVVLLERPQQLLRGGRQVPGRAAHVVPDHDRAVRRQEGGVEAAALPHADRRLDAHRPAAGEQRRARHRPGAGGGARRHAEPAHQRLRRGARPADRAGRRASPCARSRSSATSRGVVDTPDPLAGSYFVESLTDEVEARAWEYIERIDEMGGAVAAIEAGYQMDEIEQAAYEYAKSIDDDERVIVGVNRFTIDDDAEPEVFPIDPALQRGQIERLRRFKSDRDGPAVTARLDDVRSAARGTQNLLVPMRAALAADATLGEVSDALREVYGEYRPG